MVPLRSCVVKKTGRRLRRRRCRCRWYQFTFPDVAGCMVPLGSSVVKACRRLRRRRCRCRCRWYKFTFPNVAGVGKKRSLSENCVVLPDASSIMPL
ncbi:hypothetical protein CEXT_337001 [Caerostris extrusa]|uniref:Uncharacterized protein n=1 Tax=Caerostris extrusa TaxID=172846 RepID=A0AAV4XRK6_CAEEX|nr:hypothetical protein CEXT_337001 [Caerostris extrusa]